MKLTGAYNFTKLYSTVLSDQSWEMWTKVPQSSAELDNGM